MGRAQRRGAEPPGDLIEPKNFVELKTNMQITSINQEISFEKCVLYRIHGASWSARRTHRFKLLTSYLQAFLLGVATVIIGFRTRQGIVTGLQRFSTLDIPRLVRGKPHAWDPAAALGGAHQLGAFIRDSIISSPSQQLVDESFRSAVTDVDLTSERWPVFRVRYDGAARRVEVLELAEEEYEVMLTGADRQQRDRIGFLIREWVLEGWKRRRRVDPDYKLNVQVRPRSSCVSDCSSRAHRLYLFHAMD